MNSLFTIEPIDTCNRPARACLSAWEAVAFGLIVAAVSALVYAAIG